jgi:hypothetical protein
MIERHDEYDPQTLLWIFRSNWMPSSLEIHHIIMSLMPCRYNTQSIRGHHEDKVTLPDRIPACTYPDLGIVIRWILIGGRYRWWRTRCFSQWSEGRRHDRDALIDLGSADVKLALALGQHHKLSIFSRSKRQWLKGGLSAERKLDIERQGDMIFPDGSWANPTF